VSSRFQTVGVIVAGVVAAIVVTAVLAFAVGAVWPDDSSRTVGQPRWLYWAALLGSVHFIGGLAGGVVAAVLGSAQPIRRVFWVCVVAFAVMSIPAFGAFDRPIEMTSMIVLNLITALGILAGGRLIAVRR
jgi:hypothetical protein